MRLGWLALVAAPLLIGAASEDVFPTRTFVEAKPGMVQHIAIDGVWIDVAATTCGAQPLGHPGCFGDADAQSRYLVAVVRSRDGAPPLRITSDLGLGFRYAVGRLSPGDPHPSLVILTDSGGSSGCVSFQIAYARPKGFAEARLDHGGRRSEDSTFCRVDASKIAFPVDHTGHGTADFLLADDAFDCAFGSCASTWAPPRIFAFDHGSSRDVSADPSFRPLFTADAARARAECVRADNPEPKGACVAYVADSARIGRIGEAMTLLRHRIGGAPETQCTQFDHGERPRCLAETRYASFADEATVFLEGLGYPRASDGQDRSTS